MRHNSEGGGVDGDQLLTINYDDDFDDYDDDDDDGGGGGGDDDDAD